jgi:hypothetical protein
MTRKEALDKLEKVFPGAYIDISECSAIRPMLDVKYVDYYHILVGGMSFDSNKSLLNAVNEAVKYKIMEI